MPRRKTKDEPAPPPPPPVVRRALRRWAWQAVLLGSAVVLVLGGLAWLGHYAQEQIRERERFQVAFADIDCQPPPGTERGDFLDQVLYYARCPERFSLLDDGLADRLRQDFARHPWVARVDRVEVQPPRTVRVTLTYRQAVLVVVVPPELGGIRGIDREGILLPKKAPLASGLPVLTGAPPPAATAAPRWGDAGVEGAAEVAALLQPHQGRLALSAMTLSAEGLVLWGQATQVIWGQPRAAGQVTAEVKLQRLLDFAGRGTVQIDLRPAQAAQVRELGWWEWRRLQAAQ